MDIQTVPLISADSHVEEPPGLWFDELSEAAREVLPPEMRPTTESESAFARRTVEKLCGHLDPTDTEAIVHGNAARLFHFDPAVLTTPV